MISPIDLKVGATLVEGVVLVVFHRPAWGRRTPYGREFPAQVGGFLPDRRYTFWGPWGMEGLVEYARREIERATEVKEWNLMQSS